MKTTNYTRQISWSRSDENAYNYTANGVTRGTLTITKTGREADALIDGKLYKISSKGLLKFFLNVTDENDRTLLKITQDNWFTSKWEISFNHKKYRLQMKNLPLACYKVYDGEKEVLSYGLKTEKCKAVPDIKSNTAENELLLDFVVWFIFYPVLLENTDADFLLLTSVA